MVVQHNLDVQKLYMFPFGQRPSGIQETLLLFVVVVQHNLEVTKHPVKDFPKQKPPIILNLLMTEIEYNFYEDRF